MSEKEFLEEMKELMDTERDLSMELVLDELDEWDSLSYVAYLGICASVYHKKVAPVEVKKAKTIGDLFRLAQGE